MTPSRLLLFSAALLWLGCANNSSPESTSPPAGTPNSVLVDSAGLGAGERGPTGNNGGSFADTTEWTTSAVSRQHSIAEIAVVDELRSGAHEQYDRFVVEFQGSSIPGYQVDYLGEQPTECGSGHSVELAGNAILEIRLEPARGHDEEGQSTVDHGERTYNMPLLQEAEVTCDFEAIFTIALGIEQQSPFRVTEIESPPRLVVDIQRTSN